MVVVAFHLAFAVAPAFRDWSAMFQPLELGDDHLAAMVNKFLLLRSASSR